MTSVCHLLSTAMNIQKTHRALIKGLRGILKTHGPISFTVKGHSMELTLEACPELAEGSVT